MSEAVQDTSQADGSPVSLLYAAGHVSSRSHVTSIRARDASCLLAPLVIQLMLLQFLALHARLTTLLAHTAKP